MARRRHSIKRITGWSGFLSLAVALAVALAYLPTLLTLDQYRPELISLLQDTFHCRAEVGNVHGLLVPAPGLFVSRVALLEPGTSRVLASVAGVRISLSWKTLISGRLRYGGILFIRPRFVAHRDQDRQGKHHWTLIALPRAHSSKKNRSVGSVDIRSGSFEIWDHSTQPVTQWVIDHLSGRFEPSRQKGALTGQPAFLGGQSLLDVHFEGSDLYPLQIHLNHMTLAMLQSFLRTKLPRLDGTVEMTAQARFNPVDLRVTIAPFKLGRLSDTHISGSIAAQDNHLQLHLQTLDATPMKAALNLDLQKGQWNLEGKVENYSAAVVRPFYSQYWLDRLAGPGQITYSAQSGPPGRGAWSWSAEGVGFSVDGTSFTLSAVKARGTARTSVVDVDVATAQGGQGHVVWEKPAAQAAALTVNASSVSVRQVLEIFRLASTPETPPPAINPYGYESWRIDQASMAAVLRPEGVLEVTDSDIDVAGMHVDLAGQFGLTGSSAMATIQGKLAHVPLGPVLESFVRPPAPLSGTANIDFNLNFPLNARWVRSLNGDIQLDAANGTLRALKTVYRVMSVLNLTDYLRLRLPQVTAEGIDYQTLNGHLVFKGGVVYTEDLFLRSSIMNIGLQGAADLPEKRVDTKMRLELFHFLEDVLAEVPVTHWIYKKPNKILFPAVVKVKGPWSNPDIR